MVIGSLAQVEHSQVLALWGLVFDVESSCYCCQSVSDVREMLTWTPGLYTRNVHGGMPWWDNRWDDGHAHTFEITEELRVDGLLGHILQYHQQPVAPGAGGLDDCHQQQAQEGDQRPHHIDGLICLPVLVNWLPLRERGIDREELRQQRLAAHWVVGVEACEIVKS